MDQHQPKKPPTPASWKPGQSGNPRGRPPKGSALTDAIRAKVDPDELVSIALELARGAENEGTRIAALAWLRDSGYVKPAERHEHGGAGSFDDEEDYSHLSLDELRRVHELEGAIAAIVARPIQHALTDGNG